MLSLHVGAVSAGINPVVRVVPGVTFVDFVAFVPSAVTVVPLGAFASNLTVYLFWT